MGLPPSPSQKFRDEEAALGIRKLDIDWKGARFDFKQHGFPIKLKSRLITSSETLLTLKIKKKDLQGPVSLDIAGLVTVEVDGEGGVTATVPVEVEKPGKEVTLTLPFPLLDTTVITFSGSESLIIFGVDHLKLSVGRFRMDARFDASDFPDGVATTPRTLDAIILVGDQLYPGETSLDDEDLKVKNDKWEAKGRKP